MAQAYGQDHHGDSLNKTESAINSEVKVSIFRLSRVSELAAGPEVEPVVGADGGSLIDELHANHQE